MTSEALLAIFLQDNTKLNHNLQMKHANIKNNTHAIEKKLTWTCTHEKSTFTFNIPEHHLHATFSCHRQLKPSCHVMYCFWQSHGARTCHACK